MIVKTHIDDLSDSVLWCIIEHTGSEYVLEKKVDQVSTRWKRVWRQAPLEFNMWCTVLHDKKDINRKIRRMSFLNAKDVSIAGEMIVDEHLTMLAKNCRQLNLGCCHSVTDDGLVKAEWAHLTSLNLFMCATVTQAVIQDLQKTFKQLSVTMTDTAHDDVSLFHGWLLNKYLFKRRYLNKNVQLKQLLQEVAHLNQDAHAQGASIEVIKHRHLKQFELFRMLRSEVEVKDRECGRKIHLASLQQWPEVFDACIRFRRMYTKGLSRRLLTPCLRWIPVFGGSAGD